MALYKPMNELPLRTPAALLIALLATSCGGGGSGGSSVPPAPVPPPPSPAPAPTVSLTSSAAVVSFGETFSLTLRATNVTRCALTSTAPGDEPIENQGSFLDPLPRRIYSNTTFTQTCTGSAAGTSASQSVTVTVNTPPLTISISHNDIRDMAWDANHSVMYLALGDQSRLAPNSVVAFDPVTGDVLATAYAGSSPITLSVNGDGSKLSVGYRGTSQVSRFSLPALTRDFDAPIPLYSAGDQAQLPEFAIEIAAAPGNSERFAVSLLNPQSTFPGTSDQFIVYDAQTPLRGGSGFPPGTGIRHQGALFAWSGPDTLLAIRNFQFGAVLHRYDTSTPDVLSTGEVNISNRTPGRIEFAGGRVYTNCGHVIDAGTLQPQASFPRTCATVDPLNNAQMVPDLANNRAFFVQRFEDSSQYPYRLDVYAHDTRQLLYSGYLPFDLNTPIFGPLWKMVRFGADGLAITTTGGDLIILHGPFIAPGGGGPMAGKLPDEPPVPDNWWRRVPFSTLAQGAVDMAWDAHGSRLYVLIAADASEHAGQLAVFNPADPAHPAYFVRAEPMTALAVSDDGQYLYIGANDGFQRLRLPSLGLDTLVSGLSNPVTEIRVAPGMPRTVAINSQIYDDTNYRGVAYGGSVLWGANANRVYALDTTGSAFELRSYDSGNGGLQPLWIYSRIFSAIHPYPFYTGYTRMGDLLVSDTGIVFDPERGVVTGTFAHSRSSGHGVMAEPFTGAFATPAWGPMAIDEARHRAYSLECAGATNEDLCTTYFLAYDTHTYAVTDKWVLDGVGPRARKLQRVNDRDLAALTYDRRVIYIPEPEAVTN